MFTKTLDGILKNFTQTVTDLRTIADTNNTKINKYNDEILELKDKTNDAGVEKDKATKIADNLEALISGD